MPVSRYVTLRALRHSGAEFPAGTPIALSDAYAAPLLAIDAIAPHLPHKPMSATVGKVSSTMWPAAPASSRCGIPSACITYHVQSGNIPTTWTVMPMSAERYLAYAHPTSVSSTEPASTTPSNVCPSRP